MTATLSFFRRSAECSAEEVEATSGFEPLNRGFADPRPTHFGSPRLTVLNGNRPRLTTLPLRRIAVRSAELGGDAA